MAHNQAPDPILGPGPRAGATAPGLGPRHRTGAQNCNPYNTLADRKSKNAALTTHWGPGVRKLQPLQHFWAPGLENCNPYNTLGTSPAGRQNILKFAETKFLFF